MRDFFRNYDPVYFVSHIDGDCVNERDGLTPSRTYGWSPNVTSSGVPGVRILAEAYGSKFVGQCHAFPGM